MSIDTGSTSFDRVLLARIVKFGLVGLFSTGLYMLIFYFVVQHVSPILASLISYVLSASLNYFLQSVFTFQQKPKDFAMFIRFIVMHLTCMAFNAVMLWIMISQFALDVFASQASVVLLTAALSFVLASRWVFVRKDRTA